MMPELKHLGGMFFASWSDSAAQLLQRRLFAPLFVRIYQCIFRHDHGLFENFCAEGVISSRPVLGLARQNSHWPSAAPAGTLVSVGDGGAVEAGDKRGVPQEKENNPMTDPIGPRHALPFAAPVEAAAAIEAPERGVPSPDDEGDPEPADPGPQESAAHVKQEPASPEPSASKASDDSAERGPAAVAAELEALWADLPSDARAEHSEGQCAQRRRRGKGAPDLGAGGAPTQPPVPGAGAGGRRSALRSRRGGAVGASQPP
ncbi:unnamed protein product, partial [Prorocentrum cordatum]